MLRNLGRKLTNILAMWAKIHTFAASLKLKWKVLSLRPLIKDINDIHFQSHFVHLQYTIARRDILGF